MLEELLPVVLAAAGLGVSALFAAGLGASGFLSGLFGFLAFRLLGFAFGLFPARILVGFSGRLDGDFPSVPACAVQGFDDLIGFGLVHFEEREVAHQVDTSQVDAALRVTVDEADEIGGEEVVCFAHVDEEAHEARFGLAAAVLFTFSSFLLFVGADGLYFFAITVVFHEAVELVRHHALDEVFLGQPIQLAADVGHEVSYLFFVHLHFFQVVDDFHQLLFADLLGGRHDACLEFLGDDAFYFAHFALLAQVDDGDGGARLSGASGTSAAVSVAFGVVGQAVVDDVRQVVHVQSAGGHVGGHEQLQVADAKLLHHGVALRLR